MLQLIFELQVQENTLFNFNVSLCIIYVQVLDKHSNPDQFLPESYTCFFLLKLPRYSSREVLLQKLKYAIHFCKSIDTDDYARIALTADMLEGVESPDDSSSDSNSSDGEIVSSDAYNT